MLRCQVGKLEEAAASDGVTYQEYLCLFYEIVSRLHRRQDQKMDSWNSSATRLHVWYLLLTR
jgi:hypothetical protein